MTNETLDTSFYLILSGKKRGHYRELKAERLVKRMGEGIPATKQDEVALRVTVQLPKALFERPELSVSIAVDGDVPRVSVNAETMETLSARMAEIIGTPVRVSCDLPEQED